MTEAKTTKKKTTKKTAAKKKTAKKAAPKKTAAKTVKKQAEAADAHVESILQRIQAGFKEAGEALQESGHIMDEKRREVIMTIIENAQENTDATFEALRDAMDADSLAESLRIQRDALREGIERNVSQVRDVASMTAESSRESMEPVADFLSTLRKKASNSANA